MPWDNGMYGGGPNIAGVFGVFVVLFALLGCAAYLLLRNFSSSYQSQVNTSPPFDPEDPKVILDKRFASGAMTEEEYRRAAEVLGYQIPRRYNSQGTIDTAS